MDGGGEPGGSQPAEPRRGQQPDLLSLIISAEEEATQELSAAGDAEALANGHAAPLASPGTSYWSITEGPDHPLLLSPAPGPPAPRKARVQRASRPGLSRIPGRDHRRYYHEYWRSEYLMDFDPQRHGMICMVCGSSLATLKLSTIKRHIRQKHPDSLLWSPADKDLIRSGWESHLSLAPGGTAAGAAGASRSLEAAAEPLEQPQPPPSLSPPSESEHIQEPPEEDEEEEEEEEEEETAAGEAPAPSGPAPGPSARTLERYLNDSLHAWLRQEFLMEYEAEAGRLLCMVCGGQLPSLHLDHIKRHLLDTHPASLLYSSQEKHCVLQAWAHAHEESGSSIHSEPPTKGAPLDPYAQEPFAQDPYAQDALDTCAQDGSGGDGEGGGTPPPDPGVIGEDGGADPGPARWGRRTPRPGRKRRLRGGKPWRLRLDYLVACGPQGSGSVCMVCSQRLSASSVSCFRQHIQDTHPETSSLSRQHREDMAAAWTKDAHGTLESSPERGGVQMAAEEAEPELGAEDRAPGKAAKREESAGAGRAGTEAATPAAAAAAAAAASRHGHYPGKDQRRNYQARWRVEYLMEYDCGRHGLLCLVCGAALATLKVSTIKRHIQQVHPHSLSFSPEQRQHALLSYTHAPRCCPAHTHTDPHPDHSATS